MSRNPEAPRNQTLPEPPKGWSEERAAHPPAAGPAANPAPMPDSAFVVGPPGPASAAFAPGAVPAAAASERIPGKDAPFDKHSYIALLLALAQAALFSFIFYPYDMIVAQSLPGIGITLTAVAFLASSFVVLGKAARIDRATVFLVAASLALALIPAIFSNPDLRFLNCLILAGSLAMTIFHAAGLWNRCWPSLQALGASVRFLFSRMFSNLFGPLNALAARSRSKEGRAKAPQGVAAGVGIAMALLVLLIIPLLASADAMFSHAFSRIFDAFAQLRIDEAAARLFIMLVVCPLAFSLLWSLGRAQAERRTSEADALDGLPDESSARLARHIPAATQIIVLASVDLVYAAFVAVQFIYLFGGTESAHMYGGYAEYARNGFFQLAFVAAVNVCIGLLSAQVAGHAQRHGASVALKGGTLVLVAFTAVILASAALRMGLYVQAYGLTLLRLLTLLGMAFMAVLLVALIVKTFRARSNFFRTFMVAGLSLWICFNFANVDRLIVSYNLNHYETGSMENADAWYLSQHLNAETLPLLQEFQEKLESQGHADDWKSYQAGVLEDAIRDYEQRVQKDPWQMWSWTRR